MAHFKFSNHRPLLGICLVASALAHALLGAVLYNGFAMREVTERPMTVVCEVLLVKAPGGGTGHEYGRGHGPVAMAMPGNITSGSAATKPDRRSKKPAIVARKKAKGKTIVTRTHLPVKKARKAVTEISKIKKGRVPPTVEESNTVENDKNERDGGSKWGSSHVAVERVDPGNVQGRGEGNGAGVKKNGLPKGKGGGLGTGKGRGIGPTLMLPVLLKKVEPAYPFRARRLGIEGFVWLKMLVDASGKVTTVKVIQSKPEGMFDKAALQAVSKWRFEPGKRMGEPCAVWLSQPIRFRLR